MDQHAEDAVFQALLRVAESELRNGQLLRADVTALTLRAKEKEHEMLLKDKDRAVAVKEVGPILVADFLKAERDNNLDEFQKTFMGDIAFLLGINGGDDELYAAIAMASVEGKKSDGSDSSTASGGGNGGC